VKGIRFRGDEMMSLVRSLFWFALVALLFPRGPDLGLELPDSIHVPAIHVPFSAELDVPRIIAADPIEMYRSAVFGRLTEVRAELVSERMRRGIPERLAIARQPPTRD